MDAFLERVKTLGCVKKISYLDFLRYLGSYEDRSFAPRPLNSLIVRKIKRESNDFFTTNYDNKGGRPCRAIGKLLDRIARGVHALGLTKGHHH